MRDCRAPLLAAAAAAGGTAVAWLLLVWRPRRCRPRPLARLSGDCTAPQVVEVLRRDGAVVVEALVPESTMKLLADDVAALEHTEYCGVEGSFAGSRTFRCGPYLLTTSPTARALATHPLVLEAAHSLLTCGRRIRLSVMATIRVLAGQCAQVMHRDDEEWPLPLIGEVRRGVEIELSAIWAISDFRATNGATRVVVGSHGGHSNPNCTEPPPDDSWVPAEMKAGSVLFFTGSVWHGAGEATEADPRGRQAALFQYIPGWLHPEYNMHFAIDPAVSAAFEDPALRALLGHDGAHPFKVEAPGPLYATEYTGYPDRDDADFSAAMGGGGGGTYYSKAY